MGAPAWEREPPRSASSTPAQACRSLGSIILASLSEAGRNGSRQPPCRPLPLRLANRESRIEAHPPVQEQPRGQFALWAQRRQAIANISSQESFAGGPKVWARRFGNRVPDWDTQLDLPFDEVRSHLDGMPSARPSEVSLNENWKRAQPSSRNSYYLQIR